MNVTVDNNLIQTHLNLLQGIITRMANYSSSCKTWCITLVTALLAFNSDNSRLHLIWLCFLPILVFAFLDAYYLSMERQVVNQHKILVEKIHNGKVEINDLFGVKIEGRGIEALNQTFSSLASHSIWFFYGLISIAILALKLWLL